MIVQKKDRSFYISPKVWMPLLGGLTLVLLLLPLSCREDDHFVPLKIFAVEPATALIGDTIILRGEGFSPGYEYNVISFPGVAASVLPLSNSSTDRLYVRVPDGAQQGSIRVSILSDEIADSPPLNILVPEVLEIIPAEAWIGDTVVIKGRNFRPIGPENSVKFNPANVTGPGSVVIKGASTELRVIVPPSARTGAVSVLGYSGVSFTVKPGILSGFDPQQGAVGDTISLVGKGLNSSPDVSVFFTGTNATTAPLAGGTSRNLKVAVPPGAVDGPVEIRYGETTVISTAAFTVYPVITDVSPRSAPPGTTIRITGYNFSPVPAENNLRINGVEVPVVTASSRELQVQLPAGVTSGPVTLVVNGRSASGPVFIVTAPGTPVIRELVPNRGPVSSVVILKGQDFSATATQNTVRFAGDKQATVLSASATELTVRVPEGAVTGPISVTKDGKTGISSTFTLTGKPVPVIIEVSPQTAERGTLLTLAGRNFSAVKEGTRVSFSGANTSWIEPQNVSTSQITIMIPMDILPGTYRLSVKQGEEISNADKTVVVAGQPVLASVTPATGTPGMMVTLKGSEFDFTESSNLVKFGNTTAVIANPEDNVPDNVTVYVPDLPAGSYPLTLTAFGKVSNALEFGIAAKPATVRNIFYAAQTDVVTSQAVQIRKTTFAPPGTKTIYETANGATVAGLVLDLEHNEAYFDENGVVKKIGLQGTSPVSLYDRSAFGIGDLTLDVAHGAIYWSTLGGPEIYRGDTQGTMTPELLFDASDGLEAAAGITYYPGNNKLYIADRNYTQGHRLLQANPDGTGAPDVLFDASDGLSYVLDVKIDGEAGKIYVQDMDEIQGQYRLLRGNLDGSGSLTVLRTLGTDVVTGIAIDPQAQYIYWLQMNPDQASATIYRARYDFTNIPGTNPSSPVQIVYPDIRPNIYGLAGGLALEEPSGGSSQ